MTLDPLERMEIARYLELHAPPKKADLAFVFGTMSVTPALIAANLFQEKVVSAIVLTGGINRQTGRPEAKSHLEAVLARNVPRKRILIENRSTNTMENVTLTRPVLERRRELIPSQTLVAVTKWYHSRRALMTLKRFLPPGYSFYVSSYESSEIRRDNWWQTPIGRRCVLHEWRSIPLYRQQGNLAEIVLQDGTWR